MRDGAPGWPLTQALGIWTSLQQGGLSPHGSWRGACTPGHMAVLAAGIVAGIAAPTATPSDQKLYLKPALQVVTDEGDGWRDTIALKLHSALGV